MAGVAARRRGGKRALGRVRRCRDGAGRGPVGHAVERRGPIGAGGPIGRTRGRGPAGDRSRWHLGERCLVDVVTADRVRRHLGAGDGVRLEVPAGDGALLELLGSNAARLQLRHGVRRAAEGDQQREKRHGHGGRRETTMQSVAVHEPPIPDSGPTPQGGAPAAEAPRLASFVAFVRRVG